MAVGNSDLTQSRHFFLMVLSIVMDLNFTIVVFALVHINREVFRVGTCLDILNHLKTKFLLNYV
jgi:hypothetical protein